MCAFVQYLFFYTDRKIIDYSRSYHSTHPSLHALQTLSMLSLIPRSWNSEMQTNNYNQHRSCLQFTNLDLYHFLFIYNVNGKRTITDSKLSLKVFVSYVQLLLLLCVFFRYTCTPVSAFSVMVSIQCQGQHQGQHSVSRSAFSVNVNIQCKGQPLVSRSAFNIKVSVTVNIKFHNQHSVSRSASSTYVTIQWSAQVFQ